MTVATVSEVIVRHDALDYLAALGGLAGGIAALVALWFAVLSRADAKRSADASERSANAADAALAISREEAEALRAERSRRPDLEILLEARVLGTTPGKAPGIVMLTVHAVNMGTRDAENVLAQVTVPDTLAMEACDDHDGAVPTPGDVHWFDEPIGDHQGVRLWTETMMLVEATERVQYLRLERAALTSYTVHTALRASGHDVQHTFDLRVRDDGASLTKIE